MGRYESVVFGRFQPSVQSMLPRHLRYPKIAKCGHFRLQEAI
jgi:hypothetical protein